MFSIDYRKYNSRPHYMKYYETHYDDYISSVENYNLHPELAPIMKSFPNKLQQFENLIVYGPTGIGKYSQVLSLLKKYSPSQLKYDKRITSPNDKQVYIYRMSDIHYEIDMSLLGCNSKLLWHEIFFQIIDIISIKQEKIGVIVCKNFNLIHAELLDIFYSYMQHYNHSQASIKIKFILMMEHISFLPTPIVNACHILKIGRPSRESYEHLERIHQSHSNKIKEPSFLQQVSNSKCVPFFVKDSNRDTGPCRSVSAGTSADDVENNIEFSSLHCDILNDVELAGIINIKEIRSFPLLANTDAVPKDIFNIICDNIIKEISNPKNLSFTGFRDTLYDILTYNLDTTECIWYVLSFFIDNNKLQPADISDILIKSYTFLKYYNNNYRPIYHLESIMFTIINKIHNLNEL